MMRKFSACEKARILKFREYDQDLRVKGEIYHDIEAMSDEDYIDLMGSSHLNLIETLGEGSIVKAVYKKFNSIQWAKEAAKTGELEMSELPEVLQKEVAKELKEEASSIN